jgi:hypothetical protein
MRKVGQFRPVLRRKGRGRRTNGEIIGGEFGKAGF